MTTGEAGKTAPLRGLFWVITVSCPLTGSRGQPHTVLGHSRQSHTVDILLGQGGQLPGGGRHGPAGGSPASHHLVQQGGRVGAVQQAGASGVVGERGAGGVLSGEVTHWSSRRRSRLVGVVVARAADWIIVTSSLPGVLRPSPSPSSSCVEVTVGVVTLILGGTVTTIGVILGVKFLLQNEIFLSVFLPDGGQGVHIVFELSSSILFLLRVGQPPLEALDQIMVGNSASVSEHQLPH